MKTKRFFNTLILGAFLLVSPFVVQALEKEVYRVEVVIFEHLNKKSSEEALPIYTGRPNSNGAVDLTQLPADVPDEDKIVLLDQSEQLLNDTVAKLKKNRGYRVLMHEAWEQPLRPTRKIAIFKEAKPWSMQGIIELKQRRALYVTTDILLERGSNKRRLFFSGADDDITGFRIEDSRPIKLKELEYIDHPNFGILVQVVKAVREYEEVVPEKPETPEATEPEKVVPEEPLVHEIGV